MTKMESTKVGSASASAVPNILQLLLMVQKFMLIELSYNYNSAFNTIQI